MIAIIGAGPAGSYLGYLLAKAGKDVHIFEEHAAVGKPVQCTGLITSSLEEHIPLRKDFLINTLSNVRVFAPDGNSTSIQIKKNYLVDRHKFDAYIAQMAADAGAKLNLGSAFVSFDGTKCRIKTGGTVRDISPDYVVGADGPYSTVGRNCGLLKDRKYIMAIQARMKHSMKPDAFEVYLGYGDFAWIVPENDTMARIGIVSHDAKKAKAEFARFAGRVNDERNVIEWQSGVIPVYEPGMKSQKDSIFLLGDAAAQVKKTTHGGILYGMIAARELCNVIVSGKGNYDRMWKRKIGRDILYSRLISDIMLKFSEKDFNSLVGDFSDSRIKKILYEHERDFPSKMVFKMIAAKPRLLRYLLKFLQ